MPFKELRKISLMAHATIRGNIYIKKGKKMGEGKNEREKKHSQALSTSNL